MFCNIATNLRPSTGIFVGIIPNPLNASAECSQRYGIHVQRIAEVEDGSVYKVRITTKEDVIPSGVPPIVFEDYQLREEVYIKAANEAGMMDVDFRIPTLMPEGWREL